ncbi:hypothetical protein STENM327S_08734 [Streptomyces tendae]
MGAGGTGGTCPARAEVHEPQVRGNPDSVRKPMTSRLTHYCATAAKSVTPPAREILTDHESAGQEVRAEDGAWGV